MPQIDTEEGTNTYTYRQPDLTYRLGTSTIAGRVDRIEAVKQSVYHILSTERWSNPIYDDGYGVELEQYLGQDFGFLLAGIEQTLRDALTQDDRITDVQVNDVSRSAEQENACVVEFTVFTIYGNIDESLSVAQ